MTDPDDRSLWKGAVAGLAAGLVASWAMSRFQAAASELKPEGEPSTSKAADAISVAATGTHLSHAEKRSGGEAIHYLFGAALGIAYGVAAEASPSVTAHGGADFAMATSAAMDEAVVPAVGLAPAPWRSPVKGHLFGLASHMVYGIVAEATRKGVRRLLA